MPNKELESLKKQVEKERIKTSEDTEIKQLKKELLRFKHKGVVKFAVNTQKIAKILGNIFKGLGKQLSEYEQKVAKQKKEQGIDPEKENDELAKFVMKV